MKDSNSLFRSKSMDNISSPEKMDDYIHVTNPAAWMIIVLIIMLLMSGLVISLISVDSRQVCYGIKENEELVAYVADSQLTSISNRDTCIVNDVECIITSIDTVPVQASGINAYLRELNSNSADDWVYEVVVDAKNFDEGIYKIEFTGEPVRPIDYLIN